MENHPQVALLGTARQTMYESGKIKTHGAPVASPTFECMLKSNHFVNGSVMIRADTLQKIGNCNELFHYAEDYELYLRISKQFYL